MAANYPTSDPSFSGKSAGQKIQAAHVNALQDEVIAIGSALRGTVQHSLTTANSVVASSNLSIGGESTLVGTVHASSLVHAPLQPRALVFSSAVQAVPNGSFQAVTFESEQFDVGGLHSTATNPSRLTVPAGSSGAYTVGGTIRFSSGGAGSQAIVRVVKNSTTEVTTAGVAPLSALNGGSAFPFIAPVQADGGDYFEVEVFANGSTASVNITAVTRRSMSEFWLKKDW